MRVIVRRERPHTPPSPPNTTTGSLQWLEVRHRAHARVEDRISCAKDTGLGRLPSREFAINPGRKRADQDVRDASVFHGLNEIFAAFALRQTGRQVSG
jgi:hypothetical protein